MSVITLTYAKIAYDNSPFAQTRVSDCSAHMNVAGSVY